MLIALNLYCKLPFGSFDRDNAVVQEVAAKMGRTANSLAMKLCNFASFDPVQRARGIKGLEGASKQDRLTAPQFPASDRSCGRADPEFPNALESAHADLFLDSSRYCANHPRVSEDSHALPNDGSTPAVSRDLNEFAARGKVLARVLAAVLQEQLNRSLETFDAFLLRFALPVGFREFRRKGDEPFALTMDFGVNRNGHAATIVAPPNEAKTMNKDRLTKERRSWNMSRIRGKNTSPELRVRSALHRMGFRFRLHVKVPVPDSAFNASPQKGGAKVPLSRTIRSRTSDFSRLRFIHPDIVLPKYKTAIFVHGCFWHRHRGCKNCTTPTHRREWWLAKLEGNARA